MELWLTVNGKRTCASAPLDPLTRAVVISLFTGSGRSLMTMPTSRWDGGDTRLRYRMTVTARPWLLQRSKPDQSAGADGKGYIRECLQWMIDDGVVSRIDLDIRRTGINELGNSITLWRRDGPVVISLMICGVR